MLSFVTVSVTCVFILFKLTFSGLSLFETLFYYDVYSSTASYLGG